MKNKSTVIAVVNQKGGTAKTTTVENLGIGLAREGYRVLLIDTDPQASLTISLGYPQPDDLSLTLSDLLNSTISENSISLKDVILHQNEGIDFIPSNISLAGLEVSLVNTMNRERILMQLLEQKNVFRSITVMVQKEVADRIRSGPGSKEYGALSLAVQYYAEPEAVMTVSPSCFIPRPGVDSSVLCLRAYGKPPVECNEKVMFGLIRAAFNQRRKTLANAISHGYCAGGKQYTREEVTEALEEMGLPATVRGEALSLEQFAQLSLILGPEQKGPEQSIGF